MCVFCLILISVFLHHLGWFFFGMSFCRLFFSSLNLVVVCVCVYIYVMFFIIINIFIFLQLIVAHGRSALDRLENRQHGGGEDEQEEEAYNPLVDGGLFLGTSLTALAALLLSGLACLLLLLGQPNGVLDLLTLQAHLRRSRHFIFFWFGLFLDGGFFGKFNLSVIKQKEENYNRNERAKL